MDIWRADVAIIGGGPGGYVAAVRAARLGKKVVLVERDRMGGVCLNAGCIPTKALITTARHAEALGQAGKLGIDVQGPIAVNQPAAVKRAQAVAQRMSKGVSHLMKAAGVEVLTATGRLATPREVELDDGRRVCATAVILATGARPRPLPSVAFDGHKVISSTEALWLDSVPGRLVVVGAGAIGIELAYYHAVAGAEVTVVEALDSILPFADPEAVKAVARAMRRRRMEMITGARVTHVDRSGEGVVVSVLCGSEERTLEADRMLVAIGVSPNTQGLWDSSLDVRMQGPFVWTDPWGVTSLPGVYAIGDLAGPPLLAHAASHEGIIAAEHICGLAPAPKHEAVCPAVVYCQPQVAQVGITEAMAAEQSKRIRIGRYPFLASGMAQASGDSEGFVKLVFDDASGKLLGGTVVGQEAAELVSELCLAVQIGLTDRQVAAVVHPHPTYSEAIMEAAAQAAGEAIHAP